MTDASAPRSKMRDQLLFVFESLGSDHDSRKSRFTEIMTNLYVRMYADTMLGFFFAKHDLQHLVNQQVGFFMTAAGLVDRFDGRGPATAHLKLPPILSGHFDRRIHLLRETLESEKLTIPVIEAWVAYEEAFRSMVVSS
jgi:truncated hemoglobin YjbI